VRASRAAPARSCAMQVVLPLADRRCHHSLPIVESRRRCRDGRVNLLTANHAPARRISVLHPRSLYGASHGRAAHEGVDLATETGRDTYIMRSSYATRVNVGRLRHGSKSKR